MNPAQKIEIKTLEDTSIDAMAECFNSAYSDYIVPLHHTAETFQNSLDGNNIKLKLSVGAFADGQLVGFMLQGLDDIKGMRISYNGGTGVIPEMRGQQITQKLYAYILPELRAMGFKKTYLEVITGNEKALKIYQNLGYNIIRTLDCYKGTILPKVNECLFSIEPLSIYQWRTFISLWDWQPSWQNGISAMEHLFNTNISLGMYDGFALIGYLIYNPGNKRVQQFAVDPVYRNRGVATELFNHIATFHSTEIGAINVDSTSLTTASFLRSIGMHNFIQQYEMELIL